MQHTFLGVRHFLPALLQNIFLRKRPRRYYCHCACFFDASDLPVADLWLLYGSMHFLRFGIFLAPCYRKQIRESAEGVDSIVVDSFLNRMLSQLEICDYCTVACIFRDVSASVQLCMLLCLLVSRCLWLWFSVFLGRWIFAYLGFCVFTRASTSLRLYVHASLRPCTSASLRFCIFTSLHFCISASLRLWFLCLSLSSRLCVSGSLHLCVCVFSCLCVFAYLDHCVGASISASVCFCLSISRLLCFIFACLAFLSLSSSGS